MVVSPEEKEQRREENVWQNVQEHNDLGKRTRGIMRQVSTSPMQEFLFD